jgi:hypothetical protein
MKIALCLLMTALAASPILADKGGHEGKGAGPDKSAKPAKAAPAQPGHVRHDGHPPRSKEEARAWHDNRGWDHPGAWHGNPHGHWKDARAKHWGKEHYTWVQRGGYGGYYIRRITYATHFGEGRYFRIGPRPAMHKGYPRFVRRGVTFVMVDPYPETWDDKWHETDDVYVVYDRGYYLHNRKHPGQAIAIMVVE